MARQCEFNDSLYSFDGCELWRLTDGKRHLAHFFDRAITDLCVFDDYLYIALEDDVRTIS